MMTAKEARDYINKTEAEKNKRIMKVFEQMITSCIEDGRVRCYCGIEVTPAINDWLKSLGYMVEQVDEKLYLISW